MLIHTVPWRNAGPNLSRNFRCFPRKVLSSGTHGPKKWSLEGRIRPFYGQDNSKICHTHTQLADQNIGQAIHKFCHTHALHRSKRRISTNTAVFQWLITPAAMGSFYERLVHFTFQAGTCCLGIGLIGWTSPALQLQNKWLGSNHLVI